MFKPYYWKKNKYKNLSIFYPGKFLEKEILSDIYLKFKSEKNNYYSILRKYDLKGLVIESNDFLFAVTDHCKSYSIFFYIEKNQFIISDHIQKIITKKKNIELEFFYKKELLMSGYISGERTIFKKVKQLESGTQLNYLKEKKRIKIFKYFNYLKTSRNKKKYNEDAYLLNLDLVLNNIFKKIINKHKNSRIVIPLSGGLDSRLVLSKLVQHNHKKILAISYGSKNSPEVITAKKLAKSLNIDWFFVDLKRKDYKSFFKSFQKKSYWKFCDFYSSLPNNQDIVVFNNLKKQGLISKDDVIINGQTGDFISGGHIPQILTNKKTSIKALINKIIEKHYGLWINLKTEENKEIIYQIIKKKLSKIDKYNPSLEEYFEYWEYEERQSKFIISGQKTYDFLNIKWELPFWDLSYVEFWRNIPTYYKINQNLYKLYLNSYNFKNVFSDYDNQSESWSFSNRLWIRPFSVILKYILGENSRQEFLKFAKFFDNFAHFYSSYGFFFFLKNFRNIRNPNSLFVKDWVNLIEKENL